MDMIKKEKKGSQGEQQKPRIIFLIRVRPPLTGIRKSRKSKKSKKIEMERKNIIIHSRHTHSVYIGRHISSTQNIMTAGNGVLAAVYI
jgi:hypothetical protein